MTIRLATTAVRTLAVRARPFPVRAGTKQVIVHRHASDDASKPTEAKGPNMDQLPHVTEERAAIDKTMGETPPDIGQGTPVQEVLQRDPEAQKKAPEVVKEQIKKDQSGQKRSYSTSARRNAREAQLNQPQAQDSVQFNETMAVGLTYPDAGYGHKFRLPDASKIPRTDHLKRRYDTVVDQVTKSIMRHGKLSIAQKNMSIILNTLRTAPPPQLNSSVPGRALITDHSRATLPLSPIEYLTTVIDSLAPLIKIRQQRGMAGGGASLPIPMPLGKRQRRRTAIQWILTSAQGRKESKLADRVAREIINVAEGKSHAWEKRALVHKLAVSSRSNLKVLLFGMKGRKKLSK